MTFLVRRLIVAVALVFVVASAAFVLTRLAPGDAAVDALGLEAHRETVDQFRARAGLDRPIAAQYTAWLVGAAHLNFGRSLLYGRPVLDLIPERAANTAVLAVTALVLATLIGLPLGVVSGSRRGALARAIRTASLALLSMPPLLTSLLLLFVAARTGWLPIAGMRSPDAPPGGVTPDLLRHLFAPALALALPIAALIERLQSQALADTMQQPFIVAAIARGVPARRVLWRHGLRAASGPVVALYGLIVGTLLSGSFIVEVISAWPGLGRLMLDALRARDVYLVAASAGAGAVFLSIGTFAADLGAAWIDPRTADR